MNIINKVLEDLENTISKNDVAYFLNGRQYSVTDEQANRGFIAVSYVSEVLESQATGLRDNKISEIAIDLGKSVKNNAYSNAQTSANYNFFKRVMAGENDDGSYKDTTIVKIIRTNLRSYGTTQPEIVIEYDTDRVENEGVVTATLTFSQEDTVTHIIN